jgi:hypothetical protein
MKLPPIAAVHFARAVPGLGSLVTSEKFDITIQGHWVLMTERETGEVFQVHGERVELVRHQKPRSAEQAA